MTDTVTRYANNPSHLRYPQDIYLDGITRVEFIDINLVINYASAYNTENSIGMRFVSEIPFQTDNIRVECLNPKKEEWIEVKAWNDVKTLNNIMDYAMILGRRYRVIHEGKNVFEIRPPGFYNVLDIVNRSPSSYSINLHKMLLGSE